MHATQDDAAIFVYLAANIGVLGTLALVYGRILSGFAGRHDRLASALIGLAFALVGSATLLFARPPSLINIDPGLIAAALAGPAAGVAAALWTALLGGGLRGLIADSAGASAFISTALFGATLVIGRPPATRSAWIAAAFFAAALTIAGTAPETNGPIASEIRADNTPLLFAGTLLSALLVALLLAHERERHEFLASLKIRADTDALTGVASRSNLEAGARAALTVARETNTRCAVAYLDIDHFKDINDRFGHAVGDTVLKRVADCCRATARQGDLFGRLGGEEFLLVLPGSDPAGALCAAQRLQHELANLAPAPLGIDRPITASIGIASFPEDGETLERIIDLADQRCLAAKRAGRNRIVSAHPPPEPPYRRQTA